MSDDLVAIIAAICEDHRSNGFCHSPRVVDRQGFNLSGFKEQKSDIPGLKVEYVKQGGGGFTGDDFHGTMAYPLGDRLFVIEY
ncbi:MAG: hypothetical protein SV862_00075 [Pseudomonadota bacterium]|nr:hypothetical protein [Pseudomonadota bacterium]